MLTLFYLLGYLAILGFAALAFIKIRKYMVRTPLHCRWEIYPIPHEGPRAKHGGSYMEECDWWTKERKHYHLEDLKALIMEVFFLEATFRHNRPLWVRTYPFHFGLYMLMGGAIILLIMAVLRVCGMNPDGCFFMFVNRIIELISALGMLAIIGGGIGLIQRRLSDPGLRIMSAPEHFFDIGIFVAFAVIGIVTWVTNPCFATLASNFVYNMITFNWVSVGSGGFVVHMLFGFFLMIWIPVTFMSHILLKYFFYHDIRWEDNATAESAKSQKRIPDLLKYNTTWSAPHINPNGEQKTWLDVATSGYPVHGDNK